MTASDATTNDQHLATDDGRPTTNGQTSDPPPSTNEQRPACITLKPMPLKIYRLRRLLAGTAVLLTLVVAGMYSYARWRATNVLKQIPCLLEAL